MEALLLICTRQVQEIKAATELLFAVCPHQKTQVPQHRTTLLMTISVTFAKERNISMFFIYTYTPLFQYNYLSVHYYHHVLNLCLKCPETMVPQIKLKQAPSLAAVLLRYIPSD